MPIMARNSRMRVSQMAHPFPFGMPPINQVSRGLRGVGAPFGRPGRLILRRGMGQSDDGSDGSGFIDTSGDLPEDSLGDILGGDSSGSLSLGTTLTSDDGLSTVDLSSLQNYVSDASTSSAPSTGSLTSLLTGSGLNLGQVVSVLGQYLNAGKVNTQQQQYLQAELAYAQQQAQLQVAQSQISSGSTSSLLLLAGVGVVAYLVMKK